MQPEHIGRYRIVKELGRGAMGRVFLAHDPEIDRLVAIKSIQIFASLPERDRHGARERFLREARSAGKLLHPGIVTIFDVGESDGIPYLAMEYVEGTCLDAFCSPASLLPLETVVEIVARAAEALGYAHGAGIVHRDVKPANLMRIEGNGVKVMDFGLAKNPASQLTQDGSLAGTPNYMSPEQVRGEPIDGRSDLFSLAVVLYEMASGEKPFGGESVSSVLYRIVNEEPRRIVASRPGVPRGLAEFLDRALAKRPEDRFASGGEFASTLRRALATGPSDPAAPARESAAPRPAAKVSAKDSGKVPVKAPAPRRRHPVRWLAGIGVAVVLGAAAFLVARLDGGDAEGRGSGGRWLETRVRTEPPGVSMTLDGKPLAPGAVRFHAEGPFGLLEAEHECRTASRRIEPADAGREIVIVLDPVEAEVFVDPGVPGGKLRLNGEAAGSAPAKLKLGLCRENVVEVSAGGYRPVIVTIPAKATPVEARTAIAEIRLESIPTGTLLLPAAPFPVTFFVDDRRIPAGSRSVDLPEGTHRLRVASEENWLDKEVGIEIRGGQAATSGLAIPELALLVVQAFPPGNASAYLRRPGGAWKLLDEVPVRREVVPGRYEVRVTREPTGESREMDVELVPGANRPVRFAFGSGGAR